MALGRFVATCLEGKKAWLTLAAWLAGAGEAAAKAKKRLAAEVIDLTGVETDKEAEMDEEAPECVDLTYLGVSYTDLGQIGCELRGRNKKK
ncbi:hypothetical protein TSOC_001524 [Tetrabaena socialis]|uniref:Uncharacterized protein n=1 Tax=Tetrabaena socialis TaxID=47790 RepID=A0A2J8AGK0_9CHLO|nr:hypothetical protein TSOC_001524 [Tetrabaena socialis]|eukprot:PNH11637.1 hypothetical protein TSOC_001524 [Tetrabaena socialis]